MKHKVYLIPGIFGFASLGGISYFRQVNESLTDVFERSGIEVEIIGVKTLPTASLRHRARRLMMTVRDTGGMEPGVQVHWVGHSLGAIDARLAASPNTELEMGEAAELIRKNLRTVVSVSGPHYGTPLANFLTTLYGKNLLYMVTLIVVSGLRRRPITLLGGLFGVMGKINDLLGLDETLLNQVTNELLKDFSPTAEAEVRQFLRSILDDQGCMVQATPEGMDLFNSSVHDHPDVRYVSYATAAPPPTEVIRRIRLRNALTPFNKVLYSILWTLTSRSHAHYGYHPPIQSEDAITKRPLPFAITPSTSDGVVPTLSQIWGEFRGVIRADHLDVIGHYLRGPFDSKDGADWFGSGAKFDRDSFQWLWEDVAHVLMRDDR